MKDIFGFRYEDFELTGYDPHPHIKGADFGINRGSVFFPESVFIFQNFFE